MPIEMSKKIILLTEKPRISSPIKIALNSLGLDIVTNYPAITSIQVMRTGIAKSVKTAFIRTELLRFIKENGFPRAIILDSQIDLGPGPVHDPGMLKIFKTFLIAYVILSKGAECRNLRGNFILLTKGNAFEKEFGIGENPHSVMNLLSTENPEINFFIDELKENRERFNSIFSISLLDADLPSDIITTVITKFISETSTGSRDAEPHVETIQAAVLKENVKVNVQDKPEDTVTRILYRIDSSSVYYDGEILSELSDEHTSLKEREFYITGPWTSKTELEISKRIAGVIQKGINEKARFGYNDKIVVNIDDRCVIDKNTTLSLAQLFTKNLSLFKKITIIASAKNGALILKSRGYPMIRNILTVTEEAAQI